MNDQRPWHQWPKEKFPAWAIYLLYGLLLFLFIWLYPIIFDGNPSGQEPSAGEWAGQ